MIPHIIPKSSERPNVLLVNPSFNLEEQYGKLIKMLLEPVIPLSLGYLGGFLESKGVAVHLVDEQIESLSFERLEKIIKDFSPDVVGISCLTPVANRTLEIAGDVKKISKDIEVILGNVHPTVLPEECLNNENVDIVVRGEGEITLWECLQAIRNNARLDNIMGISYRHHNGMIVHTPARPYIKDLDFFPMFPWHLFIDDQKRYNPEFILTSRGCPYRCIFCASRHISGYKYRVNSPLRVISEVEVLMKEYGKNYVTFVDDNFAVIKKRTMAICDLLIERGYHKQIKWGCQTRGDAVNQELLDKMRQAGCDFISFGIETASPRLMKLIKKFETVEDNIKAVEMAHKAGIKARGSFILGFPTETREESLQTIRLARKLPLYSAKFNLATPYPGTELFDIAVKEGLRIGEDWQIVNSTAGMRGKDPVYIPVGRTGKELRKLQRMAHLRFYLRPQQLWNLLRGKNIDFNLPKIKSLREFIELSKAALSFLFKSGD